MERNTVTKSELIECIADRYEMLSSRDVELAIKTMIDSMAQVLATGGRIEIRGFGSFSVNYRPPRMGRNPRSGEQVLIPEKLVPHFKPGKALREGVDKANTTAVEPSSAAALDSSHG